MVARSVDLVKIIKFQASVHQGLLPASISIGLGTDVGLNLWNNWQEEHREDPVAVGRPNL